MTMPGGKRDLAYFQRKFTAQSLSRHPFKLLHYDVVHKELVTFGWPVELSFALRPQKWAQWRLSHHFKYPCCLCPVIELNGEYLETKVEKEVSGKYSGKWVAACAYNKCSYIVCLDDFYYMPGLVLKRYSLRDQPELAEGSATGLDTGADSATDSEAASGSDIILVPSSNKRASRPRQLALMHASAELCFFKMSRLDARVLPGMTAREFYKLFTRCRCGLIMTRHAFKASHSCKFIIDLTSEEEFEQEVIDSKPDK